LRYLQKAGRKDVRSYLKEQNNTSTSVDFSFNICNNELSWKDEQQKFALFMECIAPNSLEKLLTLPMIKPFVMKTPRFRLMCLLSTGSPGCRLFLSTGCLLLPLSVVTGNASSTNCGVILGDVKYHPN